jgi:endonuclease YncB( thermonuclease family)
VLATLCGDGVIEKQQCMSFSKLTIPSTPRPPLFYAGVDCPEVAKNKNQRTQPYGNEAKELTTNLCLHQIVKITLLRKDQYHRAVAVVEVLPNRHAGIFRRLLFGPGWKDVSMELARAGFAELYTGGGAEYWHRKEQLEATIQSARQHQRGIWSIPNRISAAEYKRLQQKESGTQQATKQQQQQQKPILVDDPTNHPPRSKKANAKMKGSNTIPMNQGMAKTKTTQTSPHRTTQSSSQPPPKRASSGRTQSTLLDAAITGLEMVG